MFIKFPHNDAQRWSRFGLKARMSPTTKLISEKTVKKMPFYETKTVNFVFNVWTNLANGHIARSTSCLKRHRAVHLGNGQWDDAIGTLEND